METARLVVLIVGICTIADSITGLVLGLQGLDHRPRCDLAFAYGRGFSGHPLPGYCGEDGE